MRIDEGRLDDGYDEHGERDDVEVYPQLLRSIELQEQLTAVLLELQKGFEAFPGQKFTDEETASRNELTRKWTMLTMEMRNNGLVHLIPGLVYGAPESSGQTARWEERKKRVLTPEEAALLEDWIERGQAD